MADVGDLMDHSETQVTVRYWAAARAAAGVDTETVELSGPVLLSEVLAVIRARHPDQRFGAVLASCSLMVGDRPVTGHDPARVRFEPGDSLEVLPPFAGGSGGTKVPGPGRATADWAGRALGQWRAGPSRA